MSLAHIYLVPTETNPLGVIGEVEDENGNPIQGIMLADVVSQVAKFPQARHFLFHCEGPGGAVDVGEQIYQYMESMKAEGKIVDTITDGDIGSIMTKPFLAGMSRTIGEDHKLYIHAPWTPHIEGNPTQIIKSLEHLIAEDNKLLSFYTKITGVTETGMKGLMTGSSGQDGTFLTADQALSMKFATAKKQSAIKAYALVKTKNMETKPKTPGQYLDQLLALTGLKVNAEIPGAQPAAAAPAPVAAALIPLESDKGPINVDAPDPNTLDGANVTDATGAPCADGDYMLSDGRVLTVAGGKVAKVGMPAAAQAPTTPVAAQPAPATSALETELAAAKAEIEALKAVNVQDQIDKAIEGFKATMAVGNAPAKAFNRYGKVADQNANRSIAAVAMEKRKQRHDNLNKR